MGVLPAFELAFDFEVLNLVQTKIRVHEMP